MNLIPLGERKTDADGNKQTGSSHMVGGTRFWSWCVGIGRYESRSEDQRIRYQSNHRHSGYNVMVDGQPLPKTYRYERTAVQAALKKLAES